MDVQWKLAVSVFLILILVNSMPYLSAISNIVNVENQIGFIASFKMMQCKDNHIFVLRDNDKSACVTENTLSKTGWLIITQKNIDYNLRNSVISENTSDKKVISVKYDEIPSYVDSKVVNDAIIDSIHKWGTINDNLTIHVTSSNDYDIHIDWKKELIDIQTNGSLFHNAMKIRLGAVNCNGNWEQYSMNTISDTIAHEIGHYLGLKHTSNENHLMYGKTNEIVIKTGEVLRSEFVSAQYYINDLGYNIPSQNSSFDTWNGSNELLIKYNELDIDHDRLLIEYDKYDDVIDNQNDYDESIEIYSRLSVLVDKMNAMHDKIFSGVCYN